MAHQSFLVVDKVVVSSWFQILLVPTWSVVLQGLSHSSDSSLVSSLYGLRAIGVHVLYIFLRIEVESGS